VKAVGRHPGGALPSLGAMRQEDIWDAEPAREYDTPGTGLFAPEALEPTGRRGCSAARTVTFGLRNLI
jgi:hypothetical protein